MNRKLVATEMQFYGSIMKMPFFHVRNDESLRKIETKRWLEFWCDIMRKVALETWIQTEHIEGTRNSVKERIKNFL